MEHSDQARSLTFADASELCKSLLPIGDQIFEYARDLRVAEFQTFAPYSEFVESFATSSQELAVHRRCEIETAKFVVATPWPMRVSSEDCALQYRSEFLDGLRAERDFQNRVPLTELTARYSGGEAAWRREIDPLRRRMIRARSEDREEYDRRWRLTCEQQQERLQKEVDIHSPGERDGSMIDEAERLCFGSAVMEREVEKFGFCPDRKKSDPSYPIFFKTLTGDWNLTWSIEDKAQFCFNSTIGYFEPSLQLRHRKLRGRIQRAELGEFLFIRYASLLPGFFSAYREFRNLNELEVLIKAHIFLYSLISSVIEDGLVVSLKKIERSGDVN